MGRKALLGVAAAALLLFGPARAERHVFPLAEAQAILSPQGAARVLVDFASMAALEDVLVTSALLEVPLPASVREENLEVAVYGLSRGWRGQGATWTTPWTRPGGDLDETYFQEARIPEGQSTDVLRLNVTQVVDAIVTEGAAAHGFVMTAPLRRGEGFTVAEVAHLGTLSGARLVVTTANAKAAGDVRSRR